MDFLKSCFKVIVKLQEIFSEKGTKTNPKKFGINLVYHMIEFQK